MLIGTIDFYHFIPLSLILRLGSQGQRKTKLLGLNFLHVFQLIRTKFDMVLKQFNLNILILLFWVRFREIAVLLTASKKHFQSLYDGGITIIYILILVWMAVTFILGHNCMGKQMLQYTFSQQNCCEFGWNLVCCHSVFC